MQVNLGLPAALLQIVAREQQGGYFISTVGELCLCLLYTSPSPRDRG